MHHQPMDIVKEQKLFGSLNFTVAHKINRSCNLWLIQSTLNVTMLLFKLTKGAALWYGKLSCMLASHMGASLCIGCFTYDPAPSWCAQKSNRRWTKFLACCTYGGNLDGVPGSWLWPHKNLATIGIWKESQWKDQPLVLSPSPKSGGGIKTS